MYLKTVRSWIYQHNGSKLMVLSKVQLLLPIFKIFNLLSSTVERLQVAYRSLKRIGPQGVSSEMSGNIHFYGMQFRSYDMCSSMLLLKFFVNCEKHSTHSEYQRSDKSSSLQEVKNNEKSLNRQPQIVVTVALSGWSFKRGLIIRLWLGKFWCFGKKVAYERCSHLEVRLYSLLFLSFHESRSWCRCRFRKINRLTLSFRALSLWSQDIKRFFFQGKNMSNTSCPKTGRCLLSKQTHHSVNSLVCSG